MGKRAYQKRFFVLGEKASIFWDPSAKNTERKDGAIKVTAGKAAPYVGPVSKRMKLAIQHGHIEEVKEAEAEEVNKEESDIDDTPDNNGPDFDKMNKDQLTAYYKANYEDVSEEDIEEFSNKKKAEMIEYLSEEDDD